MQVHVLGSAAGGGFPQWNCNCRNCRGLRDGSLNAKARTQSSITISANGEDWILFNTSPDILAQLQSFSPLQPARAMRDTAIKAIVLMDGQIDHSTGLLMLREGCPHYVYCTKMVHEDLSHGFPIFDVLKSWNGGINWNEVPVDGTSFTVDGIEGLELTAVPLVSNAPPYSPHRDNPQPGDNIGILIEEKNTGKKLFYAPGVGQIESQVRTMAEQADCVMIDGTVWVNDEMAQAGVGTKLGTDMGHLPQSGEGGMIEFLDSLDGCRKILIHINNTNPILIEDSEERKILAKHSIEVAYDGLHIDL
ncbi:MAG: pyrroloquinoline quinone biosynthesis protein PqqB [Gammaproteobacteria bacterium]|nr:pyrroloquinoline quinone biosynthesis protein PqqB [Gammaproteobacteria bacterium]